MQGHDTSTTLRFKAKPPYTLCQVSYCTLHTLMYLRNRVDQGIVFPNHICEWPLTAYSDANWESLDNWLYCIYVGTSGMAVKTSANIGYVDYGG